MRRADSHFDRVFSLLRSDSYDQNRAKDYERQPVSLITQAAVQRELNKGKVDPKTAAHKKDEEAKVANTTAAATTTTAPKFVDPIMEAQREYYKQVAETLIAKVQKQQAEYNFTMSKLKEA